MTTWAVKDPAFDTYRALYRLLEVVAIVIYVSKYFLKTRRHNPKKKGGVYWENSVFEWSKMVFSTCKEAKSEREKWGILFLGVGQLFRYEGQGLLTSIWFIILWLQGLLPYRNYQWLCRKSIKISLHYVQYQVLGWMCLWMRNWDIKKKTMFQRIAKH